MKEILKRYQRQFQIAGGICLIFVLGAIGYGMVNADAQISSGIQKEDGTVTKIVEKEKTVWKREQDSIKNKEQRKEFSPLEKSDQSEEKEIESVKEEKETGNIESPSQSEQKLSQLETKPEQKPDKQEKPQHTHIWQEKTHMVSHPEEGHEEKYVIRAAWTETITEEVYDPWDCCNVCGADCTADLAGHAKEHALAGEGGGHHTEYYKTVTRTEEHPPEYGTRWVVDALAWTETVSDGFVCMGCGGRK